MADKNLEACGPINLNSIAGGPTGWNSGTGLAGPTGPSDYPSGSSGPTGPLSRPASAITKSLRTHQKKLVSTLNRRPGVGRNDPCPCGSGLKFKRCCRAGVKIVPTYQEPT